MPHVSTGTNRQLFIDDYIVEEMRGLRKTLNQPTKYAGNPLIRPSYPWQRTAYVYGTVMYDPEQGQYRMWCQGWGGPGYTAHYATSGDGIFWRQPGLGLIEIDGSKDNNVVLREATVPNVIKDARESDPSKLYKALFWDRTRRGPSGGGSVSVAFSPDGIRWTPFESNPVLSRTGDTHTLIGWDEDLGKYVTYIRPGAPKDGPYIRLIGRSLSDDFIHWTEPEVVLAPDDRDPPGLEFYGMPVFKYEGLYLGLPWAFHTYTEEPPGRTGGTIDVQLASSRDGVRWERAGDRKPFISLGPPGSADQGMIYTAKEPVQVGDELWFYYGAHDAGHGAREFGGSVCLAKLRLDGFVSIDAGADEGTLLTTPLHCRGGDLTINADARGGTVRVAVLDEHEVETDGYRRVDCALFDGDSVGHRVTWQDNTTLDSLSGQSIRLKFYLRNARLYSLAFG